MSVNLDWDHFTEVYGEIRKAPTGVINQTRTHIGKSNISNHPEILLDLVDFDGKSIESTLFFDDYTELYHFLVKRKYIEKSYGRFYNQYDLIMETIYKDKQMKHYRMAVRVDIIEPNPVPILPYQGQYKNDTSTTNLLSKPKKQGKLFRKVRKPKGKK